MYFNMLMCSYLSLLMPAVPSPGGFTVSLYNNSAQETLKYHPPRPFLATISFALAWNMTTHWLHSGGVGNVNISILCNNERFHVSFYWTV